MRARIGRTQYKIEKEHSTGGYWKYVIGALVIAAIAANAKDLARYIKIRSM